MRSVNKVTIIGHLTRDPEVRTTSTGHKVSTFSLATNRVWKDATGQKKESVDYIDCVAWDKLAEVLEMYVGVGQAVYIEGELRTRSWMGQDGTKRYKTEVICKEVNILTWKDKDSTKGTAAQQDIAATNAAPTKHIDTPAPSAVAPVEELADPAPAPYEEVNIDDIPF